MTDGTNRRGSQKRQVVSKNVSLRPVDVAALEYLMNEVKLLEYAPVVRQLIDERMKREIGRDWEAILQAQQTAPQEEGVPA